MTLSRKGDTATVIDTSKVLNRSNGADTIGFTPSDAPASPPVGGNATLTPTPSATMPLPSTGPAGSSFPNVTVADLTTLRAHKLLIPASGVAAEKLIDSFDEVRGGGTRRHEALDIMAPRGTPVISADAGTVLKLHNSAAGGLSIYIADPTQRFIMLYAHLDNYAPGIAAGMLVTKGQLLGYVGSTGNASPTAPHLHFAIARSDNIKEWWKGTPLNPFLIWRGK